MTGIYTCIACVKHVYELHVLYIKQTTHVCHPYNTHVAHWLVLVHRTQSFVDNRPPRRILICPQCMGCPSHSDMG